MCYYANVISFPLIIGGKPLQQLADVDSDHVRADDSRRGAFGSVRNARDERAADAVSSGVQRDAVRAASTDRFFLCIKARDKKFDLAQTKAFMESLNPHGVFEIEDLSASSISATRRVASRGVAIACLGAIAMLLAGCRLDMHIQPKYLPYEPTDFFGDGRSERSLSGDRRARPVATGRIALHRQRKWRGGGRISLPHHAARISSAAASDTTFIARPATITPGTGNGMIVQRGFPQPPSYHIDRLREAPAGHFFGVMTNGFGGMYSYAARIDPADRWRIAAYIRVLQLSQHATLDDVPAADRQN